MCLGIPGQIVEMVDQELHLATVEMSGVRRRVNVGMLAPDGIAVGDWVLVHVGFAIGRIDEAEARATRELLEALGSGDEEGLDRLQVERDAPPR